MKTFKSDSYGEGARTFIVVIFVLIWTSPTNGTERNENQVFTTDKNSTTILHWTLDDKVNQTLKCQLPGDADVKSISLKWTYENGSEINDTDIAIVENTDGAISLEFSGITYDIIATYQCKSTLHIMEDDMTRTYSKLNYTNVVIFVQAQRPQGIIILMSIVAMGSIIVCLIVVKKVSNNLKQ